MRISIPGGSRLNIFIKPMLAETREQPFNDTGWIFEIKHDGYRAIAEVQDEIRLYSRSGLSYLKAYPKIVDCLKKIKHKVVLDGEIVVLDERGKSSFQKLQNYSSRSSAILVYYVFDILQLDGKNLKNLPLLERKAIVQELIGEGIGCIRYCDHIEERGQELFEHASAMGIEGVIAKKANSAYVHDRSASWLKIKNKLVNDFVVVGYLPGKNSRKYFGGLILAEKQNKKYRYRGHVGTGFSDKELKDTFNLISQHIVSESFLDAVPKFESVPTWIKPKFIVKVKYTELTEEEVIRHPVFVEIREVK